MNDVLCTSLASCASATNSSLILTDSSLEIKEVIGKQCPFGGVELQGRSIADVLKSHKPKLPDEVLNRLLKEIDTVKRSETVLVEQAVVLTLSDGKTRFYDRAMCQLASEGILMWWVDVTEREEAKQENKALASTVAQYKQEIDKLKVSQQNFLARVFHEIRTPLTAVISSIDSCDSDDSKSILESFATASAAARQLEFVANEFLDSARLMSGEASLHIVRGSFKEIAAHTVKLFTGLAKSKGLKVCCVLPLFLMRMCA